VPNHRWLELCVVHQQQADIPPEKQVFVAPEDLVAATPWVEAGFALAWAAWKVYRAYKSGVDSPEGIISDTVWKNLQFTPSSSLDELINARNEIAARFQT